MNAKFSLAYDKQKLGPLLGAVALVAAPHAFNLAPPVMAYFALLVVWSFAAIYLRLALPNKALLFLLTLAGAGTVLLHYHRFWGQEAGSSLFIVGLGLKLLETKTQRDAYLVVFLAFFVALTQYLFSQSIPMAAYTLVAVILLVAAMIGLNSNEAFPIKARLFMAASMVAQALPIMLLLFVFFPRIQGPLWELPDESHVAKAGISDTLFPGSFNRLGMSRETAFRVDFVGLPPPPKDRYWRGLVFWRTDGEKWTLSPTLPITLGQKPQFREGTYNYVITLEPHNQRWVYALDMPNEFPNEFNETTDYQLFAKSEIIERKQYRMSSGTVYQTGPMSGNEVKKGLQLPTNMGTRLQELVKAWQTDSPNPQQLVTRALRYFREQPFYYTLNPPPLSGNPVESFIFDTRRGFCEHYATSFVILMRIGGVPARVVTGYQGGQWNSIGGFLEVKQADAHAWAEVWLAESGWTRIDPTAAVAPERIAHGVDEETQVSLGQIRFNLGADWTGKHDLILVQLWRKARLFASSIDHAWNNWVLAYGSENQSQFFRWLGLLDWWAMGCWLSIGLILCLLPMAWFIVPKRAIHTDPTKRIYERFLRKLARRGIIQLPNEGPLTFADRIVKSAPEIAHLAATIIQLYVHIRYEPFHHASDMSKLRSLVGKFPHPRFTWRR